MLDLTYQYVVLAFLAFVCILMFMGKGARVLGALDVKYEKKSRKRTPEEERKAERPVAVFLMILGIADLVMVILQSRLGGILAIVIAAADVVWIAVYSHRNREKKIEELKKKNVKYTGTRGIDTRQKPKQGSISRNAKRRYK